MIRRRRFLPILAALVIAAVFTILAVVRAAAFD
jgi:hypothetical protein